MLTIYLTGLIVASLAVSRSYGQDVLDMSATSVLTVDSPSLPDHYLNEDIKYSCSFRLDGPLTSPVNFLVITPADESEVYIGCSLAEIPNKRRTLTWAPINYPQNNDVNSQSLSNTCGNSILEESSYEITVEMKLSNTMEYQCALQTKDGQEVRSNSHNIEQIREEPTGLTLSVSPSTELTVDEELTVSCESLGGNPPSRFQYGIGDVPLGGDKHKVTSLDNGRDVWCKDQEHINLNGGGTAATEQRQQLFVYYLDVNMAEVNKTLNPTFRNQLLCDSDSNLPENVSLMYKWFESGSEIPDMVDEMLEIAARVNASLTSFSCLVYSNDGGLDSKLGQKEIQFYVFWDDGATSIPTTTTKPSTKTEERPSVNKEEVRGVQSMTTVIIIVVIIVAAVILIIMVIIIVKKRQGQSGSADIKKAQTRDAEHEGAGEASETEEKKLLKNQETMTNEEENNTNTSEEFKEEYKTDPIIYAELDLGDSIPIQKLSQIASNPSYYDEYCDYAEIDPLRTKQYNSEKYQLT